MKTSQKQSGSTHIVIIIVLVVVVLGALGFVFWQNFVGKKADPNVTQVTQQDTNSDKKQLIATSVVGGQTISLKYPTGWTTQTQGSSEDGGIFTTKLTSADSKVVIQLDHSKGFYGDGTCGDSDVISLYNKSDVESTDKLKVVSIIYSFPPQGVEGSADYRPRTDGYVAGLMRTDALTDIDLGKSICSTYQGDIFDRTLTGFGYGKPAARATISLPGLDDAQTGLKPGVEVKDIQTAMGTLSYKEAIDILKSITISN